MKYFFVKVLSTFFYLGYLPVMPGTFASLAGIFIFILVKNNLFLYTILTAVLIILGFLVSGRAEKLFNKKDPKYVVIDEVCGMLLSLLLIPYSLKLLITAFVLFRILDIFKPYPIYRIQKLKGSAGIMADDIIAGLYVNIILQFVLRFTSLSIS